MSPEPSTRASAPKGAHRITTAKQDRDQHTEIRSQRVDTERLALGVAQVESLSGIFAASVLGDGVWNLGDLELQLRAIALLDTAVRNITVAVR